MNDQQRLSILALPQHYDGNELTVNIVVLPRDHNPLNPIIVDDAVITDSEVAFADASLEFVARVLPGFGINPLPTLSGSATDIPVAITPPASARAVFEALGTQMDIVNSGMVNNAASLNAIGAEHQPEAARAQANTVRKYLPKSYQKAFNFTNPKTKNAVTDDSYYCAVKDATFDPNFKRSTDSVSWGKVFAYLMRQPLLARNAGMIYSTIVTVGSDLLKDGGYLYFDLAPGSDYATQNTESIDFIKRYAARIPALDSADPRHVFAPILFPVTDTHTGNYDQLFIEAAEYDDGFAKIVHCMQPPNRDLLLEENDGAHPTKDVGIRLGWDDEQILIWYMRQMTADPSGQLSGRIDAPMGVFGYCIDVRDTSLPANSWESLNVANSKQPLTLNGPGGITELGTFDGELPFQVYPSTLDGRTNSLYWLPMYYSSWNGHSMVLPDPDAVNIYKTASPDVNKDPERTVIDANGQVLDENGQPVLDENGNPVIEKTAKIRTTGTGVMEDGAKNQLNQIYDGANISTELLYGRNYEFRVRMQDLSGGAPPLESDPLNETGSDITSCRFKRYISPNQLRISELNPADFNPQDNNPHPIVNSDEAIEITELNIKRPKLGYPAVVFTGKYTGNVVQRLINQSDLGTAAFDPTNHEQGAEHRVGLGIADPDVNRVEVIVEIESLKLDKQDSVSGREDYVHLYTTERNFPEINTDDDYESNLNIPIQFQDVTVLHTGAEVDIENDFQLAEDIHLMEAIVVPTGRKVLLTVRALCEEKTETDHGADTDEYYGFLNPGKKNLDNRFGEPMQIQTYKPSTNEENLLIKTARVPELQGIYMRPDEKTVLSGRIDTVLIGDEGELQPLNIQQLADRLNLKTSGLTLNGSKGERVVFGCSSRIRHSLAPDNSSVTFASKGDLSNHWLCLISLEMDRDWMWDALKNQSFLIKRTTSFVHDTTNPPSTGLVGDIEVYKTASFEALDHPERSSTRLVFIDAIDPKRADEFPDNIAVSYSIEPQFKPDHGSVNDGPKELELILPITTPPVQVPKIASAGIALSPYLPNEKYSATGVRRKYLWIEFAEEIDDKKDTYFARVLANAPDQLLSNNNPSLFVAPEEPPIPLDPEFIRIITEDSSNDFAGLNAMQPMVKSTDSTKHFILPLPPGLHADSDEMFGFFTYELRVGHYEWEPTNPGDDAEKVWTTSQGRFGRRLKVQGVQHPAPTLLCTPNRDEKKLWVTAPYAVAVHDGKNVTANPPRTQLWALLYAQVKQADNQAYRNILLDDRCLDWRIRVKPEKKPKLTVSLDGVTPTAPQNRFEHHSPEDLVLLNQITANIFTDYSNLELIQEEIVLIKTTNRNKNATKYGTTVWSNKEVSQLLAMYGLPEDSPLSVLVVETLPQIKNIREHIPDLPNPQVAAATAAFVPPQERRAFAREVEAANSLESVTVAAARKPSPVSDQLGHHRILRTSPLTEVPDICCPDC